MLVSFLVDAKNEAVDVGTDDFVHIIVFLFFSNGVYGCAQFIPGLGELADE